MISCREGTARAGRKCAVLGIMAAVDIRDNLLGISWVDSSWIPILNNGSVLDYFSERSNPFYDRTCNNEVVKMQRLTLDHLHQMIGVEYILLHAQEPILFIIRKQQRQSPTQDMVEVQRKTGFCNDCLKHSLLSVVIYGYVYSATPSLLPPSSPCRSKSQRLGQLVLGSQGSSYRAKNSLVDIPTWAGAQSLKHSKGGGFRSLSSSLNSNIYTAIFSPAG
ncbi:mediator of RNA polymerase II transcription subunit 6 isoform X3 [Gopherus flavomarginatus]|uniref:mediator of RNA polymerase II transcription subunit 6 isoform X3 n=1 Tax=Gopherus flavomarginatus TaxID=286002 RepID=UPI0021CC3B61|nr:mediator of RNA polymerase II transcription subunit 6 isoform X3 [Gopherus flavomarginatus]